MDELTAEADDETRHMWSSLGLSYTESQGNAVLRDEIAKLYSGITPSQVAVAAPQELIFLAMTAMVEPGDVVVVTFPGYQSLYEVARSRGCELRYWEPQPDESGRLRFKVNDLEELMDEKVSVLVVNFPHNPTGDLLSHEDFLAVVALSQKFNSRLFSDEMYWGLEVDEHARLPHAADLGTNALSLGGLSKGYSCPGLRLGWLVTQDEDVLQRVLSLRDYTTICSPGPSEVLGIMALRQGEQILARNRGILARNVALADSFFQDHADRFDWQAPLAGSIAFPRLKTDVGNIADWTTKLAEDAGVLLLPATVYGHTPSTVAQHFRLGLGRNDFETGLAHLRSYLAAQ